MNEWIKDERERARLWATTEEMGLSHHQVHEACNVESMKLYAGSFDDAITDCRVYVQAQLDAQAGETQHADRVQEAEAPQEAYR